MEWWMVKAHIKSLCRRPVVEREYYYLMFGCVNQKCIDRVKQSSVRLKQAMEFNLLSELAKEA